MKPIKVYLQYPWKFPDSPYYKYLIDNPPRGVEYLNTKKQKGVIINKKFFWFSNFLKRNIRRWTNFFGLSIPNMHLSPKGEYDLIHCAHCLSKNTNKPWVADFESGWQFTVSGKQTKLGKKMIDKIVKKDNCKKIIAWTEEAKKRIIKEFPRIKNKIEVIYPAAPLPKVKRRRHKTINLLFVGRYFYEKGGLHALEVMDRLTKKYDNVYGIIVSQIPNEIIKKYSKNKKIKLFDLMPQEKLFKIYQESDIFVYPGYSDSFGFSMLEAMSFGIPVVTVDGFARKEIVDEEKTGFVMERPKKIDFRTIRQEENKVIGKIVEKIEGLINNNKLYEKMSKNCIEIIKNGKFSIKERNKKLRRIYEDALK